MILKFAGDWGKLQKNDFAQTIAGQINEAI